MAYNQIETPGALMGDEQQQLEQMYRYLCRMAEDLNINLAAIGGNELTDSERQVMQKILVKSAEDAGISESQLQQDLYQMESLKSLIIKTASFVQTSLQEYRLNLLRETVAEGQFGKYVRNTGLDVVVNPEGITQNYTFREIIQGLREYEVNAKNYIKTGLLRYENSLPVYGVAIGKDIVTFNNQGVETYNDGNKVAELTADELSFWQNGSKVAGYTGSKISFYSSNSEVMYIQNGKIYATGSIELSSGKTIKIGNWVFSENGTNFDDGNFLIGSDSVTYAHARIMKPQYDDAIYFKYKNDTITFTMGTIVVASSGVLHNAHLEPAFLPPSNGAWLGDDNDKWSNGYITNLYYSNLYQNSSRDIKHDIRQMDGIGEKIDRLKPVTFVYDEDRDEKRRAGLIYEETVSVMPEICTEDEGNKAINYPELIPMLLKEIQDLRSRVKDLEGGN